jgi:radical SAM-linked protein
MIGLPAETEEDLDAICRLTQEVVEIGRKYWKKQLKVNVSLAPFVPKPHTPFQWAAQLPMEEVQRRYEYVSSRLERSRHVSVKRHDPRLSWIEAVLARGDRRVSEVLLKAWQAGARFDGWAEHFNFDAWLRAFEQAGVDPAFYANRERGAEEVFPWDHISTGTGKAFLRREWDRSLQEQVTPDCTREGCAGCEVCKELGGHELAGKARPENEITLTEKSGKAIDQPPEQMQNKEHKQAPPVRKQPAAVQRLQFCFQRRGGLKYLSHLDIIKLLQMGCIRAGFLPAYSEGFNPMPKMRFLPPLPLGYESRCEYFDIVLVAPADPEQARLALDHALPDEMPVIGAEQLPLKYQSPEQRLQQSEFEIRIPGDVMKEADMNAGSLQEAIADFNRSESFQFTKPARGKKKARNLELKNFVLGVECEKKDGRGVLVRMTLSHQAEDYANPLLCLQAFCGKALRFEDGVDVIAESRIID